MPDFENLEYVVAEGRAEISLDRPDSLNAFTEPMVEEVNEAIGTAMDDERVYVLILTGNGRGFCAGADVDHLGEEPTKTAYAQHLRKVQNVVHRLYTGEKPSIAAINGPAIGAGSDWALACDIRVMADSAYLREQFVNIGIIPGDGGGWLLPRLVGESKAKQYLLTGRDITPEDALADGPAIDVVPDDELMAETRELANELRDKPARAMQLTKDLIDGTRSFEEYSRQAIDSQWECLQDPEQEEAIAALRDSRDPDYGREY